MCTSYRRAQVIELSLNLIDFQNDQVSDTCIDSLTKVAECKTGEIEHQEQACR